MRTKVVFGLLLSYSFFLAFGFVPTTTSRLAVALYQSRSSSGSRRSSSDSKGKGGNGDDASFLDVEAFRQSLESRVGGNDGTTIEAVTLPSDPPPSSGSPTLHVKLPPPPLMTTTERSRRQTEQDLLRQLASGDEALTDLWDLWFQERGPEAADRLLHAQELTGRGPSHWQEAEGVLRQLIRKYGVYWAEPLNRLATLYYMQGRWEDSETLCQMVLAVKPWHFGALSGIVMVYASMHEPVKARQWASRRLPTFAWKGPNRRRKQWVELAVKDSQAALDHREDRLREWMGPQDNYESLKDAWQ